MVWKFANHIARILVIPPHREGGQAQFIERPISRSTPNHNINALLAYLNENLTALHSTDSLAERLSMSRSTFTRHFRKATGMSLNQWLIEARLQRARELLESTDLSITDIAEQSGFHSDTALRQHFLKKHKISPNRWRKQFQIEEFRSFYLKCGQIFRCFCKFNLKLKPLVWSKYPQFETAYASDSVKSYVFSRSADARRYRYVWFQEQLKKFWLRSLHIFRIIHNKRLG